MKKLLVAVLVVAVTLIGASAAMATVVGSKHDLSFGTGLVGTNITAAAASMSACQFCHTPHLRNNPVVPGAPLWNRSMSGAGSMLAADGSTNYLVYSSLTPTDVAGVAGKTLSGSDVNAPGTNSKTCLSCHDGTIGMGAVRVGGYAGAWSGTGVDAVTGQLNGGNALIGTDLRQEHPVGVIYNSSITLPGLNATVDNGNTNTIAGKMWKIYGGSDAQGTVECGSCHDPHQTDADRSPFLKDTYSTICTDCHSRK